MPRAPKSTGAEGRPASDLRPRQAVRKKSPPKDPLWAARRQFRLIAAQIQKLSRRLRELQGQIPLPDDLREREEHRAPFTVGMHLRATLEGAVNDHLDPAAGALLAAIQVNQAQLESQFYE